MGQKTGMLKREKKVITKATQKAFVSAYQNLNSGSLRMNGRNSSSRDVGSVCSEVATREAATQRAHARDRHADTQADGAPSQGRGLGAARASRASPPADAQRQPAAAGRCWPLHACGRAERRTGPSVSGSLCGERKPISRLST